MSTLMFWNKQNNNSNNSNTNNNNNNNSSSTNQNNEAKNTKNGRNWLHAPDVLLNGHVAYLVKFLGSTPVQQAKGIEVVKEAIRRLQFTQQIKKAEGGDKVKTKKVEITVSIDGVAIQIPRTQTILHQFPLHKISYCADEKKFFSFIAKTGNNNTTLTNGETINTTTTTTSANDEGHECFVFVSNKLASDITLTIGQAFDLAYSKYFSRRYVNDGGKHIELVKVQQQNKHLEQTVTVYRQRLRDLTEMVTKSDMDKLLLRLGLRDICEVPPQESGVDKHVASINGSKTPDLGIDISTPNNDDQLLIETSSKLFAPIVPPRNNQINSPFDALKPSVGTKLEGLLLNSDSDSDFDPRAEESEITNGHKISNDLFGFEPHKSLGQQIFVNNNNNINHNLIMTNGTMPTMAPLINGPPTSPPPLLAPPPKASTPRRTVQNGNGLTMNGSQDLFGSTPFGITPSAFDDSFFLDSTANSTTINEISMPVDNTRSTETAANPFSISKSSELSNCLTFNDISSTDILAPVMVDPFANSYDYMQPNLSPFNMQSPELLSSELKTQSSLLSNLFTNNNNHSTSELHNSIQLISNSNELMSPTTNNTRAAGNYTAYNANTFSSSNVFKIVDTNAIPKVEEKVVMVSKDLFGDFATSAFNEFKKDSGNIRKNVHEFSNNIMH